MPTLTEIITGFDTARAEGSAFVVDLAESAAFALVDAARSVSLGGRSKPSEPLIPTVSKTGRVAVDGGSAFLLWQRHDGAYGAIAPLSVAGSESSITASGDGLNVELAGDHAGPRPALVFALAADPFVAADFCRAAASRVSVATGLAPVAPAAHRTFVHEMSRPTDLTYAAAVEAIWCRPTTFTEPLADGPCAAFTAATHAVFLSAPTITRDRLFVDCRTEARLLKVFAHKGRDGVLGIFNTQAAGVTPLTDSWRVDDVEGLGGEQFAAWHAVERKLIIIDRGVEEAIDLPPLGAEIIHVVPILQNVAPLGLIDRLNASAAMTRVGSRKCRLADGGKVGWYAARRPSQVLLDGQPIAFDYEQANGLTTFIAATGTAHDSEVIL